MKSLAVAKALSLLRTKETTNLCRTEVFALATALLEQRHSLFARVPASMWLILAVTAVQVRRKDQYVFID